MWLFLVGFMCFAASFLFCIMLGRSERAMCDLLWLLKIVRYLLCVKDVD